ncbi:DUF3375 domain-containing protein [Paraflavitalea sp. CAU 1676]|uniref:DUF3375 domain-containing protein n=1 Tax=Paraflavitalea sp. CAU 1676 TaxID=3032598 RepID=UPI0023DA579A|nr:DUF3375 domain-containing protein [Paraflavitalea sp. CAU 1676]MDF2186785.1 DUF3375 domain-containing protein [Paraflavitalea sp. CAU 1676]
MTHPFFTYQKFIKDTVTLKLLRTGNASLILNFLQTAFRDSDRIYIPAADLIQYLAHYLQDIEYTDADQETAISELGYTYEDRARNHINRWTDEAYLHNFIDDSTKQVMYQLSRHTSKAFQVYDLLQERDFVGTESKFEDLFNKLKELVNNSNKNPDERILQLEKEKRELQRQINEIKRSNTAATFEGYQVKSRWEEIVRLNNELTGDFKEVEDNFKNIYRQISLEHADAKLTKGQLLKLTFDALDELRNNDQGKSFYAFWMFLMNDEKQEELNQLTDAVYRVLEAHQVSTEHQSLRKLKTRLHYAAKKVLDTNELLGYKLSRIVAEKEQSDRRALKETLQQIFQMAIQRIEKPGNERAHYITVDDKPEIKMPLERKPGEKPVESKFDALPKAATFKLDAAEALNGLYGDEMIDKGLLLKNIQSMLKEKSQVSLQQVVEAHPLKKGLAELLAYITLIQQYDKHAVNEDMTEDILFDVLQKKHLRLPQIIFNK